MGSDKFTQAPHDHCCSMVETVHPFDANVQTPKNPGLRTSTQWAVLASTNGEEALFLIGCLQKHNNLVSQMVRIL